MKTQTLSNSETAFLLRAKLGDIRNFGNFLTDCIRDRQNIAGYKLLPAARQHDGRGLRPVYSVAAVQDFIAKVLAAVPAAGKATIKSTVLDIDAKRGWRINKFARDGSPMPNGTTRA